MQHHHRRMRGTVLPSIQPGRATRRRWPTTMLSCHALILALLGVIVACGSVAPRTAPATTPSDLSGSVATTELAGAAATAAPSKTRVPEPATPSPDLATRTSQAVSP